MTILETGRKIRTPRGTFFEASLSYKEVKA
jgi:hypothetical protein